MTLELRDGQEQFWNHVQATWEAPDGHGVFWHGSTGVGKTHLAEAFIQSVRPRVTDTYSGHDPKFRGTALELIAEVRAAIGSDPEARNEWQMFQACKHAQVVLLDDLGREPNDFGCAVMFGLLDRALAGQAFVLVTANRDANDLAIHYGGDDGLRSRLAMLDEKPWPSSMPDQRAERERPSR